MVNAEQVKGSLIFGCRTKKVNIAWRHLVWSL